MAFTRQHKEEMAKQYAKWLESSQGLFTLSYSKMTMVDINALRAKVREAGGELHVVKNTLMTRVMHEHGITDTHLLEGTTLLAVAFGDAPAVAKALTEATAKSEIFVVKGGFLGRNVLDAAQVKALASLPPLPIMRATLLGTISAPASKLVRTLAEPARQAAAVIKAYSEKEAAPAAA